MGLRSLSKKLLKRGFIDAGRDKLLTVSKDTIAYITDKYSQISLNSLINEAKSEKDE